MIILSFFAWSGAHNTSAALVRDGMVVAAAEEERFSRTKNDGSPPMSAIAFCLKQANLSMADVDCLAIPDEPFYSGSDSQLADVDMRVLLSLIRSRTFRARTFLHKLVLGAALKVGIRRNVGMNKPLQTALESLRERYGLIPPLLFFDHHQCHAATAFYNSGLPDAAVLTIDGRGGMYSSAIWRAHACNITRISGQPYTDSLGEFYHSIARYLGFGEFGEGKVMGLAAYGNPLRFLPEIAKVLICGDNSHWFKVRNFRADQLFGSIQPNPQDVLHAPYPEIAAAAQAGLSSCVQAMARKAVHDVQSRVLCLAGGVAMNCAANGDVLKAGLAEKVWAYAASGDAGLPLGAALSAAALHGELRPPLQFDAYLGPEYSEQECAEALLYARLAFDRYDDIAVATARIIESGGAVGWFQGRMEIGPRALGNRSILADPRFARIRNKVNDIKGREPWRPLAPVVKCDSASDFFEMNSPSPFMLFAVKVRAEKQSLIEGVVHIDGTARPQTVTPRQNLPMYKLLTAFERFTGLPILLNTSFNLAGEPIVCSPTDAVKTFAKSKLDVLVLGNLMVRR